MKVVIWWDELLILLVKSEFSIGLHRKRRLYDSIHPSIHNLNTFENLETFWNATGPMKTQKKIILNSQHMLYVFKRQGVQGHMYLYPITKYK